MECTNDNEFKSEFAKQIVMEEENARNLNILMIKRQHLTRGASEASLGLGMKLSNGNFGAFVNSRSSGSVGSLSSLIKNEFVEDEDGKWINSDQFKNFLERKEGELNFDTEKSSDGLKSTCVINDVDVERLQEENAELRKRLELFERRGSGCSFGWRKYEELQRDVDKLQAKISKIEENSDHLTSTKKLVTFLDTYKHQLPAAMDVCEDVDSRAAYSPIGHYQPSLENFNRQSMGSYRAPGHPSHVDGFRQVPNLGESCVVQFNKINNEESDSMLRKMENSSYLQQSYEKSDDQRSFLQSRVVNLGIESDLTMSSSSRPSTRAGLPRSRVVMGAKTVQKVREGMLGRPRASKYYSSSSLYRERIAREEIPVRDLETVNGVSPQSVRSRSKSFSIGMMNYRDDSEIGCADSGRGSDTSLISQSSSEVVNNSNEIPVKIEKEKHSKVQKFFKRLRKLVTKDGKVRSEKNHEEVEVKRKMTRSLSHRVSKPKNVPKRLKSFHYSSPRLRKDFNFE